MAENTVEAVIRMRDLASQAMLQMNRSLELLDEAAKGADKGLRRMEAGAVSTRGTISVLTRTTRFAAIGLISELDPAIGQVVARMTSLGAVASATGSLIKGGLIVGGIALVVGALSNWVQATNRQIEFQLKLNRSVAEFNITGLRGQIRDLVVEMENLRVKSSTGLGPVIQFWKDLFNRITTGRTQMKELTDQLAQAQQAFEIRRAREFRGEMAELAGQLQSVTQAELQRRIAQAKASEAIPALRDALRQSILAEQEAALVRIKIEHDTAIELTHANELGQAERDRINTFFADKRAVLAAQTAERLVQAERTAADRIKEITAVEQQVLVARMEERRRLRLQDAADVEKVLKDLDRIRQQNLETELQDEIRVGELIREARKRQDEERVEGLKGIAGQASATIEGTLGEALQGFATGQFQGFKSLWQNLWQDLTRITADAAAKILLFGSQGFGGAAGGMGGGIFGLLGTLGQSLGLTGFQKGGLVTRPTAALLHPGERVLPADKAGGSMGGVTVINLSDPDQLAGIVAAEVSKGRDVVVNDVVQGMRGNRSIRRGIQRFR